MDADVPGTANSGRSSWRLNNDQGSSAVPTRVSQIMTHERTTSVTSGLTAVVTIKSVLDGLNLTGKLEQTATDKSRSRKPSTTRSPRSAPPPLELGITSPARWTQRAWSRQ